MSYDWLLDNPSMITLYLFVSFITTSIAYCAFPLIFANVRKEPITKKRYTVYCFLFNFLVRMLFFLLNNRSSTGPYALWTWIFSTVGVKTLKRRGVLQVSNYAFSVAPQPSEKNTAEAPEENKPPEKPAPSTKAMDAPVSEQLLVAYEEVPPTSQDSEQPPPEVESTPSSDTTLTNDSKSDTNSDESHFPIEENLIQPAEVFPPSQNSEQATPVVESIASSSTAALTIEPKADTSSNESHFPIEKNHVQPTEHRNRKTKVPAIKATPIFILLSVLLAISIGLNVFQFINNKETANHAVSQIAELEKTVSTKDDIIASQMQSIRHQNTVINDLRFESISLTKKSRYFDTICKELRSGNLGYASNNFKASESIIVVRKGEQNRKFTLTANWSRGGTVDFKSSSIFIARVTFDSNSWTTSTKMTIQPWEEGITVLTFSNSINSDTFKVIIIVTE